MPAAGFQVGAVCYPSAGAAVSAATSALRGSVVNTPSGPAVLDVVATTDSSATYTVSPLAGGPTSSHTIAVTPAICELPGASEAVELGWLVAGTWLLIYGVTLLIQYAKSELLGRQEIDA